MPPQVRTVGEILAKGNQTGGDTISNALNLLKLQEQIETAPQRKKKLQNEISAQEQALTEQSIKNANGAFISAISGNYEDANKWYRDSVNPNATIVKHPNAAKRLQGFIQIRDGATGELRDVNPYADLGIKERVKAQVDIWKKTSELNLQDQKDRRSFISDKGNQLFTQGFAPTPRAGIELAAAQWDLASQLSQGGKPPAFPRPMPGEKTSGVPFNKLPDEFKELQLNSAVKVNAAMAASPLDRKRVQLKSLPPTILKEVNGLSASNEALKQIVSRYQEFADKGILDNPGILGSTFDSLRASVNISDPEIRALKTAIGENVFKQIYRLSGAQYSDEQLERLAPLYPEADDTIAEAMGKVAALVAQNSANALNSIRSAESVGFDTGRLSELFGQIDLPVDASQSMKVGAAVLNSLPSDIRNNKDMFDTFMGALPPDVERAADAYLSYKKKPRPKGIVNSSLDGRTPIQERK